jgi:hypothetical protein
MKLVTSLFIFQLIIIQSAFCNDTTHCLFPVKLDKKWGFIDNNQKLVIPYQFDSVGYFSEDLALAEVNGSWGYLNDKGTFVIKPQFKYAEPFSCGLAKVNPTEKEYPTVFINKSGNVAFKNKYRLVYGFLNNRALVYINNRACYLDRAGKVVIRTNYTSGGLFYDGIAQIWNFNTAEFIDTTGKRVAFFNEMGHGDFNEGSAIVLGNTKTFYINKAGQKIKIKKRSFYIDKSGNVILDNTNDSLVYFSFHNGIAEVCIPGTDHKSGFIDTTGKLIVPVIYDQVTGFIGEYATVYKSGKGSIINRKGEIVADIKDYEKYFPKYVCH